MKILSGKEIKEGIKGRLHDIRSEIDDDISLAIIQVGERDDSAAYIKHKKKFGENIGVEVKHIEFPERTSEEDIIAEIEQLNNDNSVYGIIVQLPIPEYLDKRRIIESIDHHKDVDGLTSHNIARLYSRKASLVPATARGVVALLDYYDIDIAGKKAVVVGRSELAGMPIALCLLSRNATVSVCHSKTEDLKSETKTADILVVAAGVPHLITKEFVKNGATVIDVGIHNVSSPKAELEIPGKKYTGDVDFDDIEAVASGITPVPGGVGQLTVACLYENLFDAYRNRR